MKFLLLPLILLYTLNATTYDYKYSGLDNSNKTNTLDSFMYGDFQEIIRFDMLRFESNKLNEEKKDGIETSNLAYIIKTINTYIKDKKTIKIKVIGHTNRVTDDSNELLVVSDTYVNSIQKNFRYHLNTKTSEKRSKSYAYKIQKRLINNKISESLITVEYRKGNDSAFTNASKDGRDLSNRVMVTMYVLKEKLKKEIDSDNDGVLDTMDKCSDTEKGIIVDKVGCELDSDNDGVADSLDKCPDTQAGLQVDINGCPLTMTLTLNFKTNSDFIFKNSFSEITSFATFLNENPSYDVKIIGHTDNVGKETDNLLLSQKRALSTKLALIAEGVNSSRLVSIGEGELSPIISNETASGRKANRRIEIALIIR